MERIEMNLNDVFVDLENDYLRCLEKGEDAEVFFNESLKGLKKLFDYLGYTAFDILNNRSLRIFVERALRSQFAHLTNKEVEVDEKTKNHFKLIFKYLNALTDITMKQSANMEEMDLFRKRHAEMCPEDLETSLEYQMFNNEEMDFSEVRKSYDLYFEDLILAALTSYKQGLVIAPDGSYFQKEDSNYSAYLELLKTEIKRVYGILGETYRIVDSFMFEVISDKAYDYQSYFDSFYAFADDMITGQFRFSKDELIEYIASSEVIKEVYNTQLELTGISIGAIEEQVEYDDIVKHANRS